MTESGRIPGLVGSLLPSVLIAILGFMAKKLLDSYSNNNSETPLEDVEANVNEIGRQATSNWVLKRASSLP